MMNLRKQLLIMLIPMEMAFIFAIFGLSAVLSIFFVLLSPLYVYLFIKAIVNFMTRKFSSKVKDICICVVVIVLLLLLLLLVILPHNHIYLFVHGEMLDWQQFFYFFHIIILFILFVSEGISRMCKTKLWLSIIIGNIIGLFTLIIVLFEELGDFITKYYMFVLIIILIFIIVDIIMFFVINNIIYKKHVKPKAIHNSLYILNNATVKIVGCLTYYYFHELYYFRLFM